MKRIAMPRTWPLGRKGKSRYVAVPRGDKEHSLAIVIVLRDILKIVKNAKEARKILLAGEVLVNTKKVKDMNYPVCIFDIVSIPKINKHFILLQKQKLLLQEISAAEADKKIFKVVGRRMLKNGKIQINFFGGKNFISDAKAALNDSFLWDLKENKPIKHLPLKENAKVIITAGKNAGSQGTVEKIEEKNVKIKIDNNLFTAPLNRVWVID